MPVEHGQRSRDCGTLQPMRTLVHHDRAELSLPTVLYALSDPVRLQIVQMLASGEERPCGTFGLPLAKATISHHFKVLREAGIIAMRPLGTQKLTSLRRAAVDACFPGLLDAVLGAAALSPAAPVQPPAGLRQRQPPMVASSA